MTSSSGIIPSGRLAPKPQTWRIENTSTAAFIARSAWLTPSIMAQLTIARAPMRLSATASSAWRQSCGSSATTRPARCAARIVSGSSMVFGSCSAMIEFGGRPAAMKCEASAAIARSACAKVSCRGDCPVTRSLSNGSANASACGWRASTRRNNPSRVGDAGVVCSTQSPLPRPGALSGLCHHVSGRYPVSAVAAGLSIRFQRAIHCSRTLYSGIA